MAPKKRAKGKNKQTRTRRVVEKQSNKVNTSKPPKTPLLYATDPAAQPSMKQTRDSTLTTSSTQKTG